MRGFAAFGADPTVICVGAFTFGRRASVQCCNAYFWKDEGVHA